MRRSTAIAFRLLPSLVLIVLLLGTELGVRALRPRLDSLDVFITHPPQRDDFTDDAKVRVFEGDPLLFWRLQRNLRNVVWDYTPVSTNAQGLRYPSPVLAKPPRGVRVLCVGDSVTFGYRVPLVFPQAPDSYRREDGPYVTHLERWLRLHNPSRAIEVIPLAAPGYSSHQGRLWLERDIRALQPDLVTACFGWNDVNVRPATDRVAMPAGPMSVLSRRVAARSQALLHLLQAIRTRAGAAAPVGPPTTRVSVPEYLDNIHAMARAARGVGAGFAVIAPVYRDAVTNPLEAARMSGHRSALRTAMFQAGIPYLEVADLQEEGHPDNARLFGELIHPNSAGHELMAERLYDLVRERRLLPMLEAPARR